MFTVNQISEAQKNANASFPLFISEIKKLNVKSFITFVKDSHTNYFGLDNFETSSEPKYENLTININVDAEKFKLLLKNHQNGKTDYFQFCKDCAETGIEKWIVDLDKMTCIYYDLQENEILVEKIPVLI